jgi:predicted NUDIX family phosphoesterase
MITFKSLKQGTEKNRDEEALRFNLYYGKNSKAAENIRTIRSQFNKQYKEEVSYSVIISQMAAFYLRHNKDAVVIVNTERS